MAIFLALFQLTGCQTLDNNPNLSLNCKYYLEAKLGLHGLSPEAHSFLLMLNKTWITLRVWVSNEDMGKTRKEEEEWENHGSGGEESVNLENLGDISKNDLGKL